MADNIQATPRNYFGGLLTDAYNWMQSPQRTQQMQGFAGLLGTTGVPQTIERMAYGEPLTNMSRANVPLLKPETADALMTVVPMVGPAARGAEAGLLSAGRAGERYAERVVPQIMERGGLPAQLLGDLSQGSVRPMDVWHGSPYRFQKFDPSKARTGEGNASYGEGAYLAQARGTGETYRKTLAKENQAMDLGAKLNMVDVGGTPLTKFNVDQSPELLDAAKVGKTEFVDLAKSKLSRWEDMAKDSSYPFPDYAKEKITAYKGLLDATDKGDVSYTGSGFIYKVDLPDESIAKMLDYDKPLSKQAPEVQNALAELGIKADAKRMGEYEDALLDALTNPNSTGQLPKQPLDLTGEQILKELERNASRYFPLAMEGKELTGAMINPRAGVSELLGRKGVTGVRYLDQMSRGTSGGELLDVFKTPSGWKSKIKVTDRAGTGFDSPTDTFTTSMPFKTEDEARQWALDKIDTGTSNFVVFPKYQDLLTVKEINDQAVGGLLGQQAKSAFTYPQEEAMKLAQQRAALPKEQGGLGLLENNTAAEREAAMFPLKAYRGVTGDVESSVMPSDFFGSNYFGKGINLTTSPQDASKYASTDVGVNHDLVGKAELMSQKLGISYPEAKAELTRGGGAVMPISANIDNPLVVGMQKIQAPDSMIRYALNEAGYSGNVDKLVDKFKNANTGIEQFKLMQENQATPFYRSMSSLMNKNGLMIDPSLSPKSEGGMHYLATDPEQIRSRFAAFDPWRKTAATAAAMGVAAPDLLAQEQPVITQQQIDEELAKYGLLGR